MQRFRLWRCGKDGLAALLLVVASGAAEAEEASNTPTGLTHFFGDTQHVQATADQVNLSTQTGPLPFTLSGNVQSWTSGPKLADLYTEAAQGYYTINKQWKLLGQQLYQQQAAISLWNFVGGLGYSPTDDISINAMAGVGVHTLYTYQAAVFLSPQYTLPKAITGDHTVALSENFTFENYALGNFYQNTPKVSVRVASWLPQIQIGYAFGTFVNDAGVTQTQYYQPQAVRGATLTAVLHPLERIYAVLTCLPANRNYIAGDYVTQSTVGATLHVNLATFLRASAFYQDTWYEGGSDHAIGGGLNVTF